MVKQGKSMTSFFEEDHSAAKERISSLRSRIATECSSEQQLLAAYFGARMEMTERIVEDYVKVGAVTDKNAPRGMVIRKASWKNKK